MAKLVEILARAFSHWPEGAKAVIYGDCGSTAYFDMGVGYRDCIYLDELEQSKLSAGIHVVTRAEWQAAVDALKAKDTASSTAAMIDAGWIDPKPPVSPSLHAQVVGRANRIPEWDGVGLPPVGAVVRSAAVGNPFFEAFRDMDLQVVFHDHNQDGNPIAVFRYPDPEESREVEDNGEGYASWLYHGMVGGMFRPIRTPEQIAAEEREKAISDICAVFDGYPESRACRIDAARLYDAGYRKQESE